MLEKVYDLDRILARQMFLPDFCEIGDGGQ